MSKEAEQFLIDKEYINSFKYFYAFDESVGEYCKGEFPLAKICEEYFTHKLSKMIVNGDLVKR